MAAHDLSFNLKVTKDMNIDIDGDGDIILVDESKTKEFNDKFELPPQRSYAENVQLLLE